ncbi:uncharacterized protein LOC143886168 [Tasmannia lanceolata]|uniref:uncharacterized protein LOC143886168 n=1 Tax=Tasmannia lanceolata TaxID=3420 RepID=UPI00406473A0
MWYQVMAKDKFYVVFKGQQVGIFDSWADCHLQVNRYSGASYRSYATRKEAEAALNAYDKRHEDLQDKREEDIHSVPWFLGFAIGVRLGIKMVADAKSSTSEVHSLLGLKDAVLNIDGFVRGDLIDAYVYLHRHHKEARAFLSLDEMDRVEMLRRILRRMRRLAM